MLILCFLENERITPILLWDGCYWFTEHERLWGRVWGCWEGVGRELEGRWEGVGRALGGHWEGVGRALGGRWEGVGEW